jgi:hypothetical protein
VEDVCQKTYATYTKYEKYQLDICGDLAMYVLLSQSIFICHGIPVDSVSTKVVSSAIMNV